MSKKNVQVFFHCPPAPPTGTALLDPACFWIKDPSWNRLASTAYFAKTWKSDFVRYATDTNLFRLGYPIQKHAGSRGATLVGGMGGAPPINNFFCINIFFLLNIVYLTILQIVCVFISQFFKKKLAGSVYIQIDYNFQTICKLID